MKSTEELIKSALVGTDRLEPDLKGDNDFTEIIEHLKDADKETKLLALSGVIFKYNQSGRIPEKLEKVEITVAEPETLEVCDLKAANRIKNLFLHFPALLAEFLEKLVETKKILPEYLLPKLFAEGAKNKDVQEMIIQVVGKRGIWLAKQNKSWDYIFDEEKNDNEIWENETTQSRVNLLKRLRKTNSEKALEFINSSWKDESAQDKVKFLETLEMNLSLKDESFLEMALDDKRSKEVRKKASELLSKIQDSGLVKRMIERFDKLLEITGAGEKKSIGKIVDKVKYLVTDKPDISIHINTIDQPEKDLLRDLGCNLEDFDLKSYQAKVNFVTNNILNKIPLQFFIDKLKKSPEDIIKIANSDKNLTVLLNHLANQSLREKNKEWAAILLTYSNFDYLIQLLDNAEKEKFILKKLNQSIEHHVLFNYHQAKWSDDFSYQVLKIIFSQFKDPEKKIHSYPFYNFPSLANYFSPNTLKQIDNEFLPLINYGTSDYKYFTNLLNILQFRHDMLKEFNQ